MRLSRLLAVVAAVVVAFALGYATRRGGESPAPPVAGPPVLTDVVRQVLVDRYVNTLDASALASARTVPQLLAQLRDPFTSYLTSAQYAALRADTREGFYGVGVRVRPVGTALRIVGVVPKSPAARAGLRKGDMLLAVDGRRVSGRLDTALAELQAPRRGPLSLIMRRPGGHAHTVKVTRATITQHAVLVNDVSKGAVRIIRITRFSHGVAGQVRRAARDAPVVVLDLRGNPGGLISEAVATVDVFLEKGDIVSYSGAHMLGRTVQAAKTALPRMPLVVVVDRSHRERGRDRRRGAGREQAREGRRHADVRQGLDPGSRRGRRRRRRQAHRGDLPHAQRARHPRPWRTPDVAVKTQLLVHAVAVARHL